MGGGGRGTLIFSVSAFLSLSAPLLSRALSCFVYRQKSSFLFPQIRFIQLLFSESSPHTEWAIHRTCSCGPAWHWFCLAEPAWSQRCWFVFLRQHYLNVQTFCWCSWCCCWWNMVITFPEPDFIFGLTAAYTHRVSAFRGFHPEPPVTAMAIPSRAERNVSPGELQWLMLIFNRPRMLLRVLWPERMLWSIVTVLRSLHWLPISKWMAYKVLSLTSQYLRETAPRYLQEHVSPYTPSHSPRSSSQCIPSTCGFNEHEKDFFKICGFSENKQKAPVDSARTQTKSTCGFSENTKNLWIQWEQTKNIVDSVITQTKNTCGFSAVSYTHLTLPTRSTV